MGYMRAHAIVVTSWENKAILRAHKKAKEIFGEQVSSVTPTAINGYRSFLIPPDGSKEGWEESNFGDSNRKAFKDWLNSQRYEDGSTNLNWVEVQYNDDEKETKIVSHSDEV